MFLINIYPNCSIFPNDLPLEYPPKSLVLSSHPPNLSYSLKSVLPPLGNFSSLLLSLGQYYGIKYINKEWPRRQEEMKLLPLALTASPCIETISSNPSHHPRGPPRWELMETGDLCSAPEQEQGPHRGWGRWQLKHPKERAELHLKGPAQWVGAGGATQMEILQK